MGRPAVRVFRPPGLPGVECLAAEGLRVRFARHFHEGYAVGVIEHGALGFRYLGRDCLAQAGDVNLTAPGEVHDGRPACDAGWTYRMFYLDPDVLAGAARQLDQGAGAPPDFASGVLEDPRLAQGLAALHRDLESGAATLLERQERLNGLLCAWITRHAERGARARECPLPGREPGAVARAEEFLRAHAARPVPLEELARAAGLSGFRLTRAFARAMGLAPHAYQIQLRVQLAREFLSQGRPIAQAAQEAGFSDQSHLARWFKRLTGMTPGQYGKIVQDR